MATTDEVKHRIEADELVETGKPRLFSGSGPTPKVGEVMLGQSNALLVTEILSETGMGTDRSWQVLGQLYVEPSALADWNHAAESRLGVATTKTVRRPSSPCFSGAGSRTKTSNFLLCRWF